jgi:hypothetical protein
MGIYVGGRGGSCIGRRHRLSSRDIGHHDERLRYETLRCETSLGGAGPGGAMDAV